MKTYITCPVTFNKDKLDVLTEIEKILLTKKIECFEFIVDGKPEEIYQRDKEQIKSCDLIIAEVSNPSHGVGIELGWADYLDLDKILIVQEGNKISPLLSGMPKTTIVYYHSLNNLKEKIDSYLEKLNN